MTDLSTILRQPCSSFEELRLDLTHLNALAAEQASARTRLPNLLEELKQILAVRPFINDDPEAFALRATFASLDAALKFAAGDTEGGRDAAALAQAQLNYIVR